MRKSAERQTTYGRDRELRILGRDLRESAIHFCLAILALVAAIGFHVEVMEWVACGFLLLSFGRGALAILRRRRVLNFIEREDKGGTVRPVRPEDLPAIVALDKAWLGSDEEAVIPAECFEEWLGANWRSFYGVYRDDLLVGYYSLLLLKTKTMNKFRLGEKAEPDFTGKDLVGPAKELDVECLYFFSMAHRDGIPELHEGRKRPLNVGTFPLLRHAATRIAYLQLAGRAKSLYATGASPEGRKLLLALGFVLVQKRLENGTPIFTLVENPSQADVEAAVELAKDNRADGHPLFYLDLTSVNVLDVFYSWVKGGRYRRLSWSGSSKVRKVSGPYHLPEAPG